MFRQSSIIGVDLSDRTIEAVEMRAHRPSIARMSRVMLDEGIVEHGRIKDEKRLRVAFERLFAEAKPHAMRPREIVFGLPEEHVYTRVFQLPASDRDRFLKLSKAEQDQIILSEIYRSIPLDRGDVVFGYTIAKNYDAHVVVASRTVVSEWQRFFRSIQLLVRIFDVELFATFRNIFASEPTHPVLLIDIGSIVTHVAVFDQGGVRFSGTIPYGGTIFTREVQEALKTQGEEAEDRKVKIGLSENNEENLFQLIKTLEPLISEARSLIGYYKNRYGRDVEEVVLAGGSSRLPGLALYCEVNLNIPTRVGKPRFGDLEYVTAAGLALRQVEGKKYNGPFISYGVGSRAVASKKIFIFIGVLSVAVVGAALFFFLRKDPVAQSTPETENVFTKVQEVFVEVSISIDRSERTLDRAEGRIIEYDVPADASTEEAALLEGIVSVEKDLKAGEELWASPLSRSAESIRWLAYSIDDVRRISEQAMERMNEGKVVYRIDDTKVTNIHTTNDQSIFTAKVSLMLAVGASPVDDSASVTTTEEVSLPPEDTVVEDSPVVTPNVPRVLVKETETGWLNVRSGAGASFSLVTKVNPGERYELLKEDGDWYQIKLSDGKTGWAAKRYLERIIE